jgi:hypothetical protein
MDHQPCRSDQNIGEMELYTVMLQERDEKPISSNDVQSATYIGLLFLISNLLTILLTAIPVLFTFPDFIREPYRTEWYGLADVFRLLEPMVVIPFQILLFIESRILKEYSLSKKYVFHICFFSFCIGLYQQGAGFHSASNMFKHSINTVIQDFPSSSISYPILLDVKSWMRDTWEHYISHYMYAIGGILLSWHYTYLYRDFIIPNGITNWKPKLIWIANSIVYGLMIAAIGTQYPKGPFVSLGLSILYGICFLGSFLFRKGNMTTFGYCIVLQSYFLSYIVGYSFLSCRFLIVLFYGIKQGFQGRNEQ